MKIFRICPGLVGNRLNDFWKEKNLKYKNFNEIIKLYKEDNILLPGSWSNEMEKNNFQVFETVYSDINVQQKWIYENNLLNEFLNCTEVDKYFFILKEQIKKFKPDIIFNYAGANLFFPPHYILKLKQLLKDKVLMISYWGDEFMVPDYNYKSFFKFYDLIFTSSSAYTKIFNNHGFHNVYTLGNCFEPNIVTKNSRSKKHNLTFSGVTGYGFIDHIGRYDKLVNIMSRTDLKIWSTEPKYNYKKKLILLKLFSKLPSKLDYVVNKGLQRFLPSKYKLILNEIFEASNIYKNTGNIFLKKDYFTDKKNLKQLFPRRVYKSFTETKNYYDLIKNSNICLNLHRDEHADIGNIRCFETTGLGSCLITDHGKSMKEFFDIENEIVGFETLEEFEEKYNFLKNNPKKIEDIALAGQNKTLKYHTTKQRVEKFIEILNVYLNPEKKINKLSDKLAFQENHIEINLKYDLTKNPLSFDFFFFLEAAEILKIKHNSELINLYIKVPEWYFNKNLSNLNSSDLHSDQTNSQKFNNIILKSFGYFNLNKIHFVKEFDDEINYLFKEKFVHHEKYYNILNKNPQLKYNISSNDETNKIVNQILQNENPKNKKVITVTVRNYFDGGDRNTNFEEWKKLINLLKRKYFIVLIPDAHEFSNRNIINNFTNYKSVYSDLIFYSAIADFDYRMSVYENSYFNLFLNNGPCVAASLNNKIKFLMFKITTNSTPHTSINFLKELGYKSYENPKYLSKFQKYIWKDDTFENMIGEVELFEKELLNA